MEHAASFTQLFERSPEPAYVIDPLDDRIVAANGAGCSLLGYTRDELLATPVSQIHPADLPQLRDFVEQVLREGRASTITLTCRTRLGTFLPTEMSLHAFMSDGRVRILGLVQDRSDHRH
jgi:chemotaxis family two-component system sensor kinase Cph1